MRIRPKTSEQLRGQAEGFFRDQAPKSGMAKKIDAEDAEKRWEYESILDQLGVPQSIVTHPEDKKYQEYVAWLRKLSVDERLKLVDDFKNNERLYVEKYRKIVHEKKESIRQYQRSHPLNVEILKKKGFVGKGGEGFVFSYHADNEDACIIKIMHTTPQRVKTVVQAEAMRRAQGVPHAAQLICHSVEDCAYIMTYVPGEMIRPSDSIDRITDSQWQDFFDTLKIIDDKGLALDLYPPNILFDGKHFNIIDYSLPSSDLDSFSAQLVKFLKYIAFPSLLGGGVKEPKKLVHKLLSVLKNTDPEWFIKIKNDQIFQEGVVFFDILTKEELDAI